MAHAIFRQRKKLKYPEGGTNRFEIQWGVCSWANMIKDPRWKGKVNKRARKREREKNCVCSRSSAWQLADIATVNVSRRGEIALVGAAETPKDMGSQLKLRIWASLSLSVCLYPLHVDCVLKRFRAWKGETNGIGRWGQGRKANIRSNNLYRNPIEKQIPTVALSKIYPPSRRGLKEGLEIVGRPYWCQN